MKTDIHQNLEHNLLRYIDNNGDPQFSPFYQIEAVTIAH